MLVWYLVKHCLSIQPPNAVSLANTMPAKIYFVDRLAGNLQQKLLLQEFSDFFLNRSPPQDFTHLDDRASLSYDFPKVL